MSVIVERIHERMDALGLNPYRTALNAGLAGGAVHDILRGRSAEPSARTLFAIADALRCDARWLLGAERQP